MGKRDGFVDDCFLLGAGLVEKTAKKYGDARIVMTSSFGYTFSTGLDYKALTTVVPGNGSKWWDLPGTFKRYGDSKLANIWFASELGRRLRENGVQNVYCNSCHPGMSNLFYRQV